jgi:hypothetical protein
VCMLLSLERAHMHASEVAEPCTLFSTLCKCTAASSHVCCVVVTSLSLNLRDVLLVHMQESCTVSWASLLCGACCVIVTWPSIFDCWGCRVVARGQEGAAYGRCCEGRGGCSSLRCEALLQRTERSVCGALVACSRRVGMSLVLEGVFT